jgi:hypothetical protein
MQYKQFKTIWSSEFVDQLAEDSQRDSHSPSPLILDQTGLGVFLRSVDPFEVVDLLLGLIFIYLAAML